MTSSLIIFLIATLGFYSRPCLGNWTFESTTTEMPTTTLPPPPAPPDALNCFVCRSDKQSGCTQTKPSGDAKPAVICPDLNQLFNNWIKSLDFMKFGFGDMNVERLFNLATEETNKEAGLKNVTACAYLVASSENAVTKEVDKSVAKVRSFFGDENANDPLTIQKWVMRDCVTIMLNDDAENEANRCVPVAGASTVAKIHLCTCTTDKCNLPDSKVDTFIKQAESSSGPYDGPMVSGYHFSFVAIFSTVFVNLYL